MGFYSNPRLFAFCLQHCHYLFCRVLAEQLLVLALFIVDAMLLDQLDKIPLSAACNRRFAEVRIGGEKIFGFNTVVGKVATPATGHQNLLADFVGLFQ